MLFFSRQQYCRVLDFIQNRSISFASQFCAKNISSKAKVLAQVFFLFVKTTSPANFKNLLFCHVNFAYSVHEAYLQEFGSSFIYFSENSLQSFAARAFPRSLITRGSHSSGIIYSFQLLDVTASARQIVLDITARNYILDYEVQRRLLA